MTNSLFGYVLDMVKGLEKSEEITFPLGDWMSYTAEDATVIITEALRVSGLPNVDPENIQMDFDRGDIKIAFTKFEDGNLASVTIYVKDYSDIE